MAASGPAQPRAGIDYPRTLVEFGEFFHDEKACVTYLEGLRWPEGHVATAAWRLEHGLNVGSTCRRLDMWNTCNYRPHMPKMIQLRHVPDDLHRKLKARAALEGLSLSDYLVREVRRITERPTLTEMQARLARRAPVSSRESPARAVRGERDAR